MSFGNAMRNFGVVEEALVLALMMVAMFAVFSVPEMDMTYRITIVVIAFVVVLLTTIATAILRQQKEAIEETAKRS